MGQGIHQAAPPAVLQALGQLLAVRQQHLGPALGSHYSGEAHACSELEGEGKERDSVRDSVNKGECRRGKGGGGGASCCPTAPHTLRLREDAPQGERAVTCGVTAWGLV